MQMQLASTDWNTSLHAKPTILCHCFFLVENPLASGDGVIQFQSNNLPLEEECWYWLSWSQLSWWLVLKLLTFILDKPNTPVMSVSYIFCTFVLEHWNSIFLYCHVMPAYNRCIYAWQSQTIKITILYFCWVIFSTKCIITELKSVWTLINHSQMLKVKSLAWSHLLTKLELAIEALKACSS